MNGDLPIGVRVLEDLYTVPDAECTDEGRAMSQIVHDVAPGASISFHTAFTSEEDFAAGITALADDGAKVIVDDVGYFDEPMFEDGVIAKAIDAVAARGVAYFSAAGNEARHSYQAKFRPSGRNGLAGMRHDFDRGGSVADLQRMTAPPGTIALLAVDWDQPSFSANGINGAQSDIDAIFYNTDGSPVEPCTDDAAQLVCQVPGIADNIGGDAVELPVLVNLSDREVHVRLGIELAAGRRPDRSSTSGTTWVRPHSRSMSSRLRAPPSWGIRMPRAPRPSAPAPGIRPRPGAARYARRACRPVWTASPPPVERRSCSMRRDSRSGSRACVSSPG